MVQGEKLLVQELLIFIGPGTEIIGFNGLGIVNTDIHGPGIENINFSSFGDREYCFFVAREPKILIFRVLRSFATFRRAKI